MYSVKEVKLTRSNEPSFRSVFKECFPQEVWANSVPFPDDDVVGVYQSNILVGFCMMHFEPPYKWEKTSKYIYNVCVLPQYRRKGVFRKMITNLRCKYTNLCMHVSVDSPIREFLLKEGWNQVGLWREKFFEMATWGKNVELTPVGTDHYDPDNNIVYLS